MSLNAVNCSILKSPSFLIILEEISIFSLSFSKTKHSVSLLISYSEYLITVSAHLLQETKRMEMTAVLLLQAHMRLKKEKLVERLS